MTVKWSKYAAGLSSRPMKGMLTGPITIICWSFPRADVPRMRTAFELADALHEEVRDLEKAGLAVIQVDEPALREGLPLLAADRDSYLAQAVESFNRICTGIDAQIHTHMCYAEFSDIAHAIAAMDADVISLESSRTAMEELADLRQASHAGGVGPGVYDVHSPRVPEVGEMVELLEKALASVPAERLWVKPGLRAQDQGLAGKRGGPAQHGRRGPAAAHQPVPISRAARAEKSEQQVAGRRQPRDLSAPRRL